MSSPCLECYARVSASRRFANDHSCSSSNRANERNKPAASRAAVSRFCRQTVNEREPGTRGVLYAATATHFHWQVLFLEDMYWLQSCNVQDVDTSHKIAAGPYQNAVSTARRLLSLAPGWPFPLRGRCATWSS